MNGVWRQKSFLCSLPLLSLQSHAFSERTSAVPSPRSISNQNQPKSKPNQHNNVGFGCQEGGAQQEPHTPAQGWRCSCPWCARPQQKPWPPCEEWRRRRPRPQPQQEPVSPQAGQGQDLAAACCCCCCSSVGACWSCRHHRIVVVVVVRTSNHHHHHFLVSGDCDVDGSCGQRRWKGCRLPAAVRQVCEDVIA